MTDKLMNRSELNAAIRDIPMPDRFKKLPISDKGFPIPYFVGSIDGVPDFRVVHPGRIADCHNRRRCWLCGEPLGVRLAFVIGPMCSINRVSSEPPSHRECAEYAVRACPFLSKPRMVRNEKDMPDGSTVAGIACMHNPGATLIWMTKSYKLMRVENGVLFQIGEPLELFWFKEGRKATRAEIDAAIAKGLPLLRKMAESENAMPELKGQIARMMKLLPAE
jgi:hypothetical protein